MLSSLASCQTISTQTGGYVLSYNCSFKELRMHVEKDNTVFINSKHKLLCASLCLCRKLNSVFPGITVLLYSPYLLSLL